jgi:hypothetical protein
MLLMQKPGRRQRLGKGRRGCQGGGRVRGSGEALLAKNQRRFWTNRLGATGVGG